MGRYLGREGTKFGKFNDKYAIYLYLSKQNIAFEKASICFVFLNNDDISNNVAMKTTIQTTLQHPKNIDSKYHEGEKMLSLLR